MPLDRYNLVQKDRFAPPPSRDRYNPPPYNRHSIPPKRSRFEEEEDDYDDDDSMDDFIVDDEAEDVEKELRSVLRKYCRSDETVWQKREREIDLSKMNARFHDIDAEEKRSTRIARFEDMLEEHRGSKAL
uniref:Protein SPT2 homolog n=1 Tax=Panagrolaimus davidi TaxID=227884 RepID=A0A914PYL1_9BILA